MTLGELILQYINEHDLSIRKFAQLSGVSHSYISYLIAGKKPNGLPLVPTIDKCVQIASAMGMIPKEQAQHIEITVEVPEMEKEPTAWENFCTFLADLFA